MAYNVALYKYADNKQQLRFYSYPVHENDAVTESRVERRALSLEKRLENIGVDPDIDSDSKKQHSFYVSKNRTIQNIYAITRANKWDYFVTLTFDPEKVDSTDYSAVSRIVGKWLNNLRSRYCPDLKYLCVPELHKDGKKWHIHALFANCDELPLSPSGKHDRKGRVIYNLPTYRYGFSTATKVYNNFAVCAYVTKYITKELVFSTKNRKRVWVSHNVDRPELIKTRISSWELKKVLDKLGNNIKHAKTCGDDNSYIQYFEIENGEKILNPYLLADDGFVPCSYDWENIHLEYPWHTEDEEHITRLKRKRDESFERMRKVMLRFSRRPDYSAPSFPDGVPERIVKQRKEKGLRPYEETSSFMAVGDMPDFAFNW